MSGTPVTAWLGRELSGGRYRVDAQLGEGGMGTVFRAWDKNLSTEVVIKVPHAAMLQDAEFAARFAREISSLVKLSHPHIVKISDVGDHDRLPFAVMQFLPGGSLEDRQKSDPAADVKPLPPESLKSWLVSIAEALDFVHSQGYIHRDVKPANILFDAHGHAYLSDFGIAKSAEGGPAVTSKTLTGSGMVIGTPEYMAPELIMGQTCDGRVDQYALVVTVFEILAGRRPFEDATSTAVLVQHSTKEPPDLASLSPDVPAGLASAIRKGLSKSPGDRFANCRKFADAVLAAVNSVSKSDEPKAMCPACQKVLKLSDKLRGMEVPCPGCKTTLRVSNDLRQVSELKSKKNPNTGGNGTRVVGVRGESAVGTQSESATTSAPVTQETTAMGQPSSRTKPTQSPASTKKEQTVTSKTSHVPKPQAADQEPPAGNKKWLSIAAGGAAIVVLLGITIFVLTGRGTVKITVNGGDDSIQVKVDGDEITITGLDESLKLSAGEHGLTVTSPRFETVTKSFKVTRGDTTVVEVELRPLSPMANTPERQTVAGVEAVPVAASEPLVKKEQVRPVAVKFDLPPIEAMNRPIDADAIATAKVDEGIRQLKSRARVAAVKEFEEALKIDPGIAFKEIPSLNDGQIIGIRAALYDDDKGQSKQSKALELYREGMATSEKANYSHAIASYKAAADFDPAFAWSANNLAWLLATCPDRNVRDGKLAVEYAFKACQASSWSYWSFQSTLAAALAEAGAYEQAVAVQKLSKENYSSIRGSEEDFGHEEWQLNLARFEQGQRPDYPASWAKKVAAAAFKIQLDRNQAIYQRTTLKLGGSLIDVPEPLQRSPIAEVDFGDGGVTEPVDLAPDRTFQLEHVYPTPGEFLVTVVVSASKTDSVKATATVTVKALTPVPDVAALDKSRKSIHDIFKREFADANKTAARIAWSEKLIEQGQQTADDPAGRYVLFDEAALQAVEAPEPNLAFRAIEEMAKTFDINKHAKKAELLALTVENTKFASFYKKSAEAGLVAFEDALQNDDFASASDFLKATQKAAEAGKELGLLKKVTTASEELVTRKKSWDQVIDARKALKMSKDEPTANQCNGSYLCFVSGKWSAGLPFLAKGPSGREAELAVLDLKRSKSAQEQLAVADGWKSLADGADTLFQPQQQRRAAFWYRRVAPQLTGLTRQRVDDALQQLGGTIDRIPTGILQINKQLLGLHENAAVACSQQKTLIVWQGKLPSKPDWDIYGCVIDSDGTVGDPFVVNQHQPEDQIRPSVAASRNGSFTVVWESMKQDGSESGIFSQQISPSGLPSGREFQVNSFTANSQTAPRVATNRDGRFLVVWESLYQVKGFDVFGQFFSETGSKDGAEIQINQSVKFNQRVPSVSMMTDGSAVVAYQAEKGDNALYDIGLQRLSKDRAQSGVELIANTHSHRSPPWGKAAPDIATDGVRRFVVVWHDYHGQSPQDGNESGVFAQVFDLSGKKIGREFQVNATTKGSQADPSVAILGNGDFNVVWHGNGPGDSTGVFCRLFSPDGKPLCPEVRLNDVTDGKQLVPRIATSWNGQHAIAVWHSDAEGGKGVFAKWLLPANVKPSKNAQE